MGRCRHVVDFLLCRWSPWTEISAALSTSNFSGGKIPIVSQLFQLSDDILAFLVSNWLDVRAICSLDNSITNREQRHLWLRCLSKVIGSVPLDDQIYNMVSIRWLLFKGFSTSKLTLNCDDRIRFRISGHLPLLTTVDVRGSRFISDQNLEDIVKMSGALKFLHISGCKYIYDIGYIPRYCPKLVVFEAENTGIINWCAGSIADKLHDLEVLNLVGSKMADRNIAAIAYANPKLSNINLKGCDITDSTALALANSCPNLNSVCFSNCHHITDAGIIALAAKCPLLQTIDIQHCYDITDKAIFTIAEKCHHLLHLNLRNLNNITDTAISAIARGCPQLLSIDLVFCNNVTSSGISALTVGCPGLVIQRKNVAA